MVVKEVQNVCVIHDRHKGILQAMDVTPDFTRKTECISYVRQDHLHTHDRQNESNTITVIKRTRV
jgi:hypothetical protein